MASSDSAGPVPPQVVEYDRITGVPSEFNEYLPKCACRGARRAQNCECSGPVCACMMADLQALMSAQPAVPTAVVMNGLYAIT